MTTRGVTSSLNTSMFLSLETTTTMGPARTVTSLLVGGLGLHVERGVMTMALQPS